MPNLCDEVRDAKRRAGLSYQDLADIASGLARKAGVTKEEPVSKVQVIAICGSRRAFRLDDPTEPLPYVLKALGLTGAVVLRGLGMEA